LINERPSLFEVGEYETGKKESGTQELRKKRWNKTVVFNLNAELREGRYRQTGFP